MGKPGSIIDSKVAFETVGDIPTKYVDSNMDSMYMEDQGKTNPRNLAIFSDAD